MRIGEMNAAVHHNDYETAKKANIWNIQLNSVALAALLVVIFVGKDEVECSMQPWHFTLIYTLFIFLPPYILRLVS